jgi:CheY-like chemotaxis protein
MGIQTALVVVAEDEPVVRMVIVDALAGEGFEVMEAGHAAEAISHLEARGRDVRVLFTDVQMPGEMDGVALANHARNRWPQIGVIVTSGQAVPKPHELPHGSRIVPKPYKPALVLAHVRELVGS